jgi:cell division protein FtsB
MRATTTNSQATLASSTSTAMQAISSPVGTSSAQIEEVARGMNGIALDACGLIQVIAGYNTYLLRAFCQLREVKNALIQDLQRSQNRETELTGTNQRLQAGNARQTRQIRQLQESIAQQAAQTQQLQERIAQLTAQIEQLLICNELLNSQVIVAIRVLTAHGIDLSAINLSRALSQTVAPPIPAMPIAQPTANLSSGPSIFASAAATSTASSEAVGHSAKRRKVEVEADASNGTQP